MATTACKLTPYTQYTRPSTDHKLPPTATLPPAPHAEGHALFSRLGQGGCLGAGNRINPHNNVIKSIQTLMASVLLCVEGRRGAIRLGRITQPARNTLVYTSLHGDIQYSHYPPLSLSLSMKSAMNEGEGEGEGGSEAHAVTRCTRSHPSQT